MPQAQISLKLFSWKIYFYVYVYTYCTFRYNTHTSSTVRYDTETCIFFCLGKSKKCLHFSDVSGVFKNICHFLLSNLYIAMVWYRKKKITFDCMDMMP